MKRLLEYSRYLALIAVAFSLLAGLAALAWGAIKTVSVVRIIIAGQTSGVALGLVQVMDAFLIAAALLIFALGIYELFIGSLSLPQALAVSSLDDLKEKLATVVVLVLSVLFVERVETGEPLTILYVGIGVAVVGAMLIALARKK